MDKEKYYVCLNLTHDGEIYERHAVVELTEEQAAPLLADGVIAEEDPVDPTPPENRQRVVSKSGSAKPKVGGEPSKSGEPSVDTTGSGTSEDEDVDLEKMSRAELEDYAVEAGISREDAEGAANKGALIEMIEEKQGDPSTNL